jgi:hypothetical protein
MAKNEQIPANRVLYREAEEDEPKGRSGIEPCHVKTPNLHLHQQRCH